MPSYKDSHNTPFISSMYRKLLDYLDIGIHMVNAEGRSIIYNRKMSEMEDMNPEEVLNKKIMDIFLFESEEESRLLQALYKDKLHKDAKQVYFNFKGQEITTVNNTFPLTVDGEKIGAVEIARDITKLERLSRETSRGANEARFTFDQIIGESKPIIDVVENARRATRTASSVLIYGETGTGKELFAQSIHNGSTRASKPFISQNCAALPDTLIEGILFGSVKGAFTGATDHPGLFEQAHLGTLMLDEINSLSASLQAKLLRAIQEKSIRRIGDTKNRQVDVRIIATMNEDPVRALETNQLREDLYYRLSVVSIMIPPLRYRKDDLIILIAHFIRKYNRLFQMNVPKVTDDVLALFNTYDWPGNVRELEHVIEGAMNLIYDDEPIAYQHLPLHMKHKFSLSQDNGAYEEPSSLPASLPDQPLQEYMETIEKAYLEKALHQASGNVSQAAKSLGIQRQSLQYRMKKYHLSQ
ncbi:sigma-54 interaction domain-containing protein [Salisediminibacterium beveridgei]|uniref:Arginine utilization regulatory protein RocR n=1 Tax=Salisediminibacterium beveridgei TaxID=632773 RepID=A0A1D7QYS1_9BACI|nr:sigma 54-interacting transcriptional regulator [Salisediminibacterium beveridgei]AOM84149.1 Arginine utilization regulatory protein RocR [Salisediminibacterium beveridgei]